MKKRLLFVIESLACAGAEKSLVTLLNLLDYSKYEVDLQLFAYGGEFEALLPKEVHLLPVLPYFEYQSKSLKSCLFEHKSDKEKRFYSSRLHYSFELRLKKMSHAQKAVALWKCSSNCFENSGTMYDAAIAYAQGVPTYYVADKVTAKKKFGWINVSYRPEKDVKEYITSKYRVFDKVVCVSQSSLDTFVEEFEEIADKGTVIRDMYDGRLIVEMSKWKSSVEKEMNTGKVKLLTVGRLAPQKGYDIALDACEKLVEAGMDFCWYVLGKGPLQEAIERLIHEKGLEKYFVLLGTQSNPYPYFTASDIYVQTSKTEGFGIAIAEARMLNIPVVTTEFDAVYTQMVNGENGLVTGMSGEEVAKAIQRLVYDTKLYEHIVEYEKMEDKGNFSELKKFEALFE